MKKLNYLLLALILMFSISNEVKALTGVDCITASGKQTCTLDSDLEVSEKIVVQGEIELDLNGHTIRPDNNLSVAGGLVIVSRNAKLTIKDTSLAKTGKITSGDTGNVYAAVQLTWTNEGANGKVATLVVDGGTLEGYYYAVVGNGNRHNTSVTINGGSLIGLNGSGIYHPQEGSLVINGGTITGTTGIEIRSGSLTVNGGTITGTATPVSVTPNGNGTTTDGAGIAIAQHTTLKDINVNIKGGTINGYSAVYESNPQHNNNVTDQVSVSITNGTFNATNGGTVAVYSEDLEDFIVSGTFNIEIDEDYVSNMAKMEIVNGNYVYAPDNYSAVNNETDDTTNVDINTTYESAPYTAPVEMYDINLSWDDLHWVFVYEGEASNPSRYVWLSKEAYETLYASMPTLSTNEINGEILNDMDNLDDPDLNIAVENRSVFAINVVGSVETKNNVDNYTNPAGLKIALETTEPMTYANSASISALSTNTNANLLVKPTAVRFVNNDGVSTNVTGEVKLTFTKSN